jgi:hypothetical protein
MWICGEQVTRTGEWTASGGGRLRTGSAGERGRGLGAGELERVRVGSEWRWWWWRIGGPSTDK